MSKFFKSFSPSTHSVFPAPDQRMETDQASTTRFAFWSSLVLSLATALIGILATFSILRMPGALKEWRFLAVILAPFSLTIVSITSAVLTRLGRMRQGVSLLLVVFLVWMIGLALLTQGYGIVLGMSAFVVTAGIAAQIFPPTQVNRLIIIGTFVGLSVFMLDMFGIPGRLPGPPSLQVAIPVIASLAGLFYLYLLIRQFPRYAMLTKLMAPFIIVVLASIGILSVINYNMMSRALTSAAQQALLASAKQTAIQVDGYLQAVSYRTTQEARLSELVEYLQLPVEERSRSAAESHAMDLMRRLQTQEYVLFYSLLDTSGRVLLDTRVPAGSASEALPQYLGLGGGEISYINRALVTGSPYLSPVIFDGQTEFPGLYFAARVLSNNGEPIGLLFARCDLQGIQSIVNSQNNLAGKKSFALLVDENGLRLAHGLAPDAVFTFIAPLSTEELKQLIAKNRLPPRALTASIGAIATNIPEFRAGLIAAEEYIREQLRAEAMPGDTKGTAPATAKVQPLVFSTSEVGTGTETNQAAVARVENQRWYVVFLQPESIFLQPITDQTRIILLSTFGIAVVTILAAVLIARVITRPISLLTSLAEKVTSGDFSVKVAIDSQDEIGALGKAFNVMNDQIQSLLLNLEQRVEERTSDLLKATGKVEYRAKQFQVISEVARAVASERDLERLLPLVVKTISERFGFYHVGIFLLDDSREYAVLRAASSEGGEKMLAHGHRLRVGQVGIIGHVTQTGEPRIAMDVGQDAVFFNNPDLPATRSEVGLPLVIAGAIIGALDVQSEKPSAFTEEDLSSLTTLANQVAIAIDNARWFGETRRAFAELQVSQREYLREQWEKAVAERARLGYEYRYGQVMPMTREGNGSEQMEVSPSEEDVASSGSIWEILDDKGLVEVLMSGSIQESGAQAKSLVIPIMLRGQVIGMINIAEAIERGAWAPEQITFAKAVADQVGLALENARLLEETQRRAEREALVSKITTHLRASNDPAVILKTAITELRQALGVSTAQVMINPEMLPSRSENE